jgi:phosphoglycolate phosphatase
MNVNPVRAVIIDLDGTLMDTAGEIASAMARTLDELRMPRVPAREIETMIGRGVAKLVERVLERIGAHHLDLDATVARFEAHYAKIVGTSAVLFPGAAEGLARMHDAGLKLAVVTNKPRFFTEQLLARAQVARFFAAVVAGDDGVKKKPAGDMLVAACRAMGSSPAATLMLGDSDNDVAAARAAGCPVWCVPYGYNEGRPADGLACDRLVASIDEAARLVTRAV